MSVVSRIGTRTTITWKETRHGSRTVSVLEPGVPCIWSGLDPPGGPDHLHRQCPNRISPSDRSGNMNSTIPVNVMSSPLDLGEARSSPANGWVSGWAINNVPDELQPDHRHPVRWAAGFKNAYGKYAIFGDADGNGNPVGHRRKWRRRAASTPRIGWRQGDGGRVRPAQLGKSNSPGTPTMIAGIPADKTPGGHRDRRVHRRQIQRQPGPACRTASAPPISGVSGNLAFNPSRRRTPGFEFSITNFSKAGSTPRRASGSRCTPARGQDVVAGEAGWSGRRASVEAQQIPEPTTWMVWAGLAGGLAWRRIRSRRAQP